MIRGTDAAQLRLDASPVESYRRNPSDSMAYGSYAAVGVDVPFHGGWALRLEQLGSVAVPQNRHSIRGCRVWKFRAPCRSDFARATIGVAMRGAWGPITATVLAWVSTGCGTEYRDPIVASNDDPLRAVEGRDHVPR
ncbi:MAG: hypothetical protein QM784_25945 [Polyangiaceae bacterium]